MKLIKTGILGGTFNPIHFAHLAMAKAAQEQAHLDEIWFMPSKNPPHKSHKEIVSERHRSQMIRLAIAAEPAFRFSDFELKRSGTTYTAETLRLLKQEFPDHTFYFIMGGDSFFALEEWFHPEQIMEACELIAIARGATEQQMKQHADYLLETYGARIDIVQMENMEISSSQIRSFVGKGLNITGLTPKAVEEYMQHHKLYQ